MSALSKRPWGFFGTLFWQDFPSEAQKQRWSGEQRDVGPERRIPACSPCSTGTGEGMSSSPSSEGLTSARAPLSGV